ncbi:MAG: S41 family peptidase [Deltaproteobacteria bacterium]|nr:S41 family peptidase [Deltaproteobacteria bacterium]
MRKLRGSAFFCGGVVAALVAMLLLGAASALPRSYSPYRKLNLFARVLTYVENNYVEHVDDSKLVHGAIKGMLESLDPHSVFMPPDQYRQMKSETQGEFGGLGVEVEVRDGWLTVISPLEGTPAHRGGMQSGDQILEIDGKSSRDLRMEEAVRSMRGARGTRIRLKLRRGAKTFELSLVRDLIRVVSVTSKLLAPGVGYVRIKSFQERTDAYLRSAVEELQKKGKLRGLVLDLRNNPGGLLDQAIKVADLFLPGGIIVKTTGKGGRMVEVERAQKKGTLENFPVVCLVNGGSASASEIVAGALQDHKRAAVLGTRTFGKGSVQTIIDLEDGSGLKLTVARYYTPAGRSIQEHGIEPDILVQPSAPVVRTERVTRERDLRGHLRNEQARKALASKGETTPRLADFQLQTAIDYLRAAEIFRANGG